MRLVDAEPIEKYIEDGLNEKDPKKRFGHDAIEIMTEIHYAPTIVLQSNDQPSNAPLTLEELREMDGEPVWCEILVKGHRSLFGIIHGDTVTGYVPGETYPTSFKTNEEGAYGVAWLAYRRRPEEV